MAQEVIGTGWTRLAVLENRREEKPAAVRTPSTLRSEGRPWQLGYKRVARPSLSAAPSLDSATQPEAGVPPVQTEAPVPDGFHGEAWDGFVKDMGALPPRSDVLRMRTPSIATRGEITPVEA